LLALANLALHTGVLLPELKEIRTLGEVVGDDVRATCKQAWNVPLVDQYSCQEAGYLALQCPEHEHYHLQSESSLVEILNDENKPCMPGEIGRVVLTTLHNYATPLIRYEIGDYAQLGDPCSCGRGLPVLTRILGRTRNMLHLPNGETRWPLVGSDNYRRIAPISQFQLIQHTREQIEVKLVMPEKLTPVQTQDLIKMMHSSLGYPFELKFNYVDSIPRSAGGKHEDFISRVI
jgi:phenylacetate-CoA ligase